MALPIKEALKITGHDKVVDQVLDTAMKSAFVVSAMGGTFLLVRHLFRQAKDSAADEKALAEGNPAYYATLIGSTLNSQYWFGDLMYIDRENLYRIFRSIPANVSFEQIKTAFKARYNKSLVDELESKLYPDEYRKVLSIINYGNTKT